MLYCKLLGHSFPLEMSRYQHIWLRAVPVKVSERELYEDLIILDMYNYNVISGMDFSH